MCLCRVYGTCHLRWNSLPDSDFSDPVEKDYRQFCLSTKYQQYYRPLCLSATALTTGSDQGNLTTSASLTNRPTLQRRESPIDYRLLCLPAVVLTSASPLNTQTERRLNMDTKHGTCYTWTVSQSSWKPDAGTNRTHTFPLSCLLLSLRPQKVILLLLLSLFSFSEPRIEKRTLDGLLKLCFVKMPN